MLPACGIESMKYLIASTTFSSIKRYSLSYPIFCAADKKPLFSTLKMILNTEIMAANIMYIKYLYGCMGITQEMST